MSKLLFKKRNLNRLYLFILFLGLGPFSSVAQKARIVSVGRITGPSDFFWMITGNGLKDTSYIYGTLHMVCKDRLILSPEIKNALLRTQVFYTEIQKFKEKFGGIQACFMKGDTTLQKVMGKDYYAKIKKILQPVTPIPEDTLNRLPPFIISMEITRAMMPCKTTSYDIELWKIANTAGLKLLALETGEEHMRPINAIPLQKQADSLKKKLDHLEKSLNGKYTFISMYKPKESLFEDKESFLYQRNRNWVLIIEKAIQQNPCFFAFGSAHLLGEPGIVKTLLAMGYTLTPIKY